MRWFRHLPHGLGLKFLFGFLSALSTFLCDLVLSIVLLYISVVDADGDKKTEIISEGAAWPGADATCVVAVDFDVEAAEALEESIRGGHSEVVIKAKRRQAA